MNKKVVTVLIISMCFGLLRIALIQVYWISSALKMRNEEFDLSVNNALNNLSKILERNEQLKFAHERFVIAHETDSFLSKNEDQIKNRKTGTLRLLRYYILDSTFSEGTKTENHTIRKIIRIVKKDSIYQTHPAPVILKTNEEKIDLRANGIVNILKKIITEKEKIKQPLIVRIPLKTLPRLIRQELAVNGIDLHFEFCVTGDSKPDSVIFQSAMFKNNASDKSYKTILYPNDILSQNGILILSFDNRYAYIIRYIWVMLCLSLLFTLIIFLIFVYTIRVILKQKQLSEIKNDFINNITHEFKTPIATISLATDAINNPFVLYDGEKVRHYATIIKEENKRMHEQVEKVLQIALTEKNDFDLHKKPVDLHVIIGDILNNFELQIKQINAKVNVSLFFNSQ